jgi:hypothetical protein
VDSFGGVEYTFGDRGCVNRVYKITNLTVLACDEVIRAGLGKVWVMEAWREDRQDFGPRGDSRNLGVGPSPNFGRIGFPENRARGFAS